MWPCAGGCGFGCVVWSRLRGGELRDDRHDAESVAREQDAVGRVAAGRGQLGVGDVGERVRAARVLGEGEVLVVDLWGGVWERWRVWNRRRGYARRAFNRRGRGCRISRTCLESSSIPTFSTTEPNRIARKISGSAVSERCAHLWNGRCGKEGGVWNMRRGYARRVVTRGGWSAAHLA